MTVANRSGQHQPAPIACTCRHRLHPVGTSKRCGYMYVPAVAGKLTTASLVSSQRRCPGHRLLRSHGRPFLLWTKTHL